MLPKRWLLTALALACVLAVGCTTGARAPEAPAGPTSGQTGSSTGGEPGKVGGSGTESGSSGTGDATGVSSTISLVDHPWIKSPARVTAFSKAIRIQFSGPVDRTSVEERVASSIMNAPYTLDWSSDQEALLTLAHGCSLVDLSMAGAKDAAGQVLSAELSPGLYIHYPCHGTGYTVINAVDGKVLEGWPQNLGVVEDSSLDGVVLGSVGTIYFLLEAGEIRPLAYTESSAWARFLYGGDVLIADGASLRRVDRQGNNVKEFAMPGEVVQGAVSPQGQAALVLVGQMTPGTRSTFQAIFVDLESGTMKELGTVTEDLWGTRLLWRWASNDILALSDNVADWTLDLETGKVDHPVGTRKVASPDTRWVVDLERMGIFPTNDPSAPARMSLTEEMLHPQWPPTWAPDSRHLVMGGGQVIDIKDGTIIRSLADLGGCPTPPQPLAIGHAGSDLFVAYQLSCH